jgi:hypothetical protein
MEAQARGQVDDHFDQPLPAMGQSGLPSTDAEGVPGTSCQMREAKDGEAPDRSTPMHTNE